MRLRSFLCSAILLICVRVTAEAHQPRLVTGNKTEVKNPEVSQAFYAELRGKAQRYVIGAKDHFSLYVQLTIPDHKDMRRDFKVTISLGKKIIAKIDGDKAKWKRFYEPFGGDYYLLGPDFDQANSEHGKYSIEVSNRGNTGKYVLVFGKKEQFPPAEMMRTMSIMPKVKEFMRPPSKPVKTEKSPCPSAESGRKDAGGKTTKRQ